jgi:pimeloyl-ACP methyl ester carboxylesterase
LPAPPCRTIVFLPGVITPAALQYGPLLKILANDLHPVLKDLEVYATDAPAPGYQLNHEVQGLKGAVDAGGYETFHLFGYSGGGAVALAYVAV